MKKLWLFVVLIFSFPFASFAQSCGSSFGKSYFDCEYERSKNSPWMLADMLRNLTNYTLVENDKSSADRFLIYLEKINGMPPPQGDSKESFYVTSFDTCSERIPLLYAHAVIWSEGVKGLREYIQTYGMPHDRKRLRIMSTSLQKAYRGLRHFQENLVSSKGGLAYEQPDSNISCSSVNVSDGRILPLNIQAYAALLHIQLERFFREIPTYNLKMIGVNFAKNKDVYESVSSEKADALLAHIMGALEVQSDRSYSWLYWIDTPRNSRADDLSHAAVTVRALVEGSRDRRVPEAYITGLYKTAARVFPQNKPSQISSTLDRDYNKEGMGTSATIKEFTLWSDLAGHNCATYKLFNDVKNAKKDSAYEIAYRLFNTKPVLTSIKASMQRSGQRCDSL